MRVVRSRRAGRNRFAGDFRGLRLLQQLERVGTGDERDDEDQNEHSDTATTNHRAAAQTAAIFDVRTPAP